MNDREPTADAEPPAAGTAAAGLRLCDPRVTVEGRTVVVGVTVAAPPRTWVAVTAELLDNDGRVLATDVTRQRRDDDRVWLRLPRPPDAAGPHRVRLTLASPKAECVAVVGMNDAPA